MNNVIGANILPSDEIIFHPLSWVDPSGRVLWWKGRLFRGIREERCSSFQDLFSRGVIDDLVKKKLIIETWKTDWTMDGFPLIMEHRVIHVISYPAEWCASMLKAAGPLILYLVIELRKYGCTLQDGHPWNVLFDGISPYYIDIGSIVPLHGNAPCYPLDEFQRFFSNPLVLFNTGHSRVARRLLQDSISGVSSDEIKYLGPNHIHAVIEELKRNGRRAIPTLWASAGQHIWKVISAWSRKIAKGNPEHAGIEQILALRETVRQMRIVLPETNWADYYGESYLDFKSRAHWKSKEISVADILDEVKPKSVLDIGSNRGWFSILAARTGAEVIASDIDEPSLNKLFDDCTNQKIRLLPIFMDIRDPLPAYGLCYEWFPAASTRLKVEMVLGLAVVHHLAPQLGFPPEVDQKRR